MYVDQLEVQIVALCRNLQWKKRHRDPLLEWNGGCGNVRYGVVEMACCQQRREYTSKSLRERKVVNGNKWGVF